MYCVRRSVTVGQHLYNMYNLLDVKAGHDFYPLYFLLSYRHIEFTCIVRFKMSSILKIIIRIMNLLCKSSSPTLLSVFFYFSSFHSFHFSQHISSR